MKKEVEEWEANRGRERASEKEREYLMNIKYTPTMLT